MTTALGHEVVPADVTHLEVLPPGGNMACAHPTRCFLHPQGSSRTVMSNVLATSHISHFTKFKLLKMKYNVKFKLLVTLVPFPVLSSRVWVGAARLDGTDIEHFLRHRKFYWTVCVLDSLISSLTHIQVCGLTSRKLRLPHT